MGGLAQIMNIDYSIFQLINNLAGHWAWLDGLSIFGAAYLQYFLGAGVIIFVALKKDLLVRWDKIRLLALFFITAVVSRFVFGEIIKRLVARPRPFQIMPQVVPLIPEDLYTSFPSGHMAFFFAFSTAVYAYNKKAGLICFAGSLLMGLARIYTGVHYPSDILGGALLGWLIGWLSIKLFKRYYRAELLEFKKP